MPTIRRAALSDTEQATVAIRRSLIGEWWA
jgi:hypothetical protein